MHYLVYRSGTISRLYMAISMHGLASGNTLFWNAKKVLKKNPRCGRSTKSPQKYHTVSYPPKNYDNLQFHRNVLSNPIDSSEAKYMIQYVNA